MCELELQDMQIIKTFAAFHCNATWLLLSLQVEFPDYQCLFRAGTRHMKREVCCNVVTCGCGIGH